MNFGVTASSYVDSGGGGGGSAYANEVLADSPLLYWRLGETSGVTAVDSSGNGRDGTYMGTPGLDRVGLQGNDSDGSVYFEDTGGGDYATLASSSWMNVSDMTITCAVVFSAQGLRMFASRYHDPDNNRSWFVYSQNREFKFYVRGSDGNETIVSSGFTATPGVVYFLTAYSSNSGAGIRIYDKANGLVASATGVGRSVNPSTRPFMVGRCDGVASYQHESYIDEVAYYGSVLSGARLDTLASVFFGGQVWLNRSVNVLPRNGTLDHTVNFTPAAAGSLLVAILSGPMTNTMVTGGWTEHLQPIDSAELSVFTKTASLGESSLAVTHNNPNRPLQYAIYEFPSGSAYHSGTYHNTGAWQTLNGLPATPNTVLFYALAENKTNPADPQQYAEWYFPAIENLDYMEPHDGATDGIYTTIACQPHYKYASAGSPIINLYGSQIDNQVVTFAVTVP